MDKLSLLYRTAPDAGTRGAAEWLLRAWGQESQIATVDRELAGGQPSKGQSWFVNGQGQTMVVIPAPGKVTVGSPPTELNREPGKVEDQHPATIGYSYAIAAHEVTLGEFLAFNPNYLPNAKYLTQGPDGSPDKRCPVNNVTAWYPGGRLLKFGWSQQEHLEACLSAEQRSAVRRRHEALRRFSLPHRLPPSHRGRMGMGVPMLTQSPAAHYGQADGFAFRLRLVRRKRLQGSAPAGAGRLKPNELGLVRHAGQRTGMDTRLLPQQRREFPHAL